MAIGDNYITADQVKQWTGLQGSEFDVLVEGVCTAMSRSIEDHCRRQFNKEASPSARVYQADDPCTLLVDDFYTTTGLVIQTDEDGDGVFETTWDASDFELHPLNGVRNGRPGFPYWKIRARRRGLRRFPWRYSEARVQVTAAWGWASVPDVVVQAAKIIVTDTFQLKDQRFGVAGTDQFGTLVRVRNNPIAKEMLNDYVRGSVLL
jgi:hypothetical protein